MQLNNKQKEALEMMLAFSKSKDERVLILKGYAGTGKTTIVRSFLEEVGKNVNIKLLASTGRAAKILSNITHSATSTIHSEIYSFKDLNQDLEKVVADREAGKSTSVQLSLTFELKTYEDDSIQCIYVIDESSMISDVRVAVGIQAEFGSGCLLSDLLFHNPKGKYLFVGDKCQLPPIVQEFSPALSAEYFERHYKIKPKEIELTDIVRQQEDCDIIQCASQFRALYSNPPKVNWMRFPFRGFHNVTIIPSREDFIAKYIDTIQNLGFDQTTLICQSNTQCDKVAHQVRPLINLSSGVLQVGDLLLITQNNPISGLVNGDLVVVDEIAKQEQRATLDFLHVKVKELSSQKCYSQLIIENVIYQNATNLTQEQSHELFIDFFIRMKKKGIKQKSEVFNSMMMSDPYLNALRAVYGYGLTCHKAQGGEWDYVFIDLNKGAIAKSPGPKEYQWLYTAITRAKKQIYLTNGFYIR